MALVIENTVCYEKYIEGKNDHAKYIVSVLDEALKQNHLSSRDLDAVVIGYGPGSYTGVRMSVTVGKILATFSSIQLYAISTLTLMASGFKGICKVSIDARRGNAFSCVKNISTKEVLLADGLYSYTELEKYSVQTEVTEDNFKVDPIYCFENAEFVEEPRLFVPNYLRETEAERNAV